MADDNKTNVEVQDPVTNPAPGVDKQPTQQPDNDPEKQPEKTFTQDEVNKIISDRLAREKAKQEEADKLKKMNADEKKDYELEKVKSEADQAKAELAKYRMRDEARNLLAEAGVQITDSDIDLVVTAEAESTKANVKALTDLIKRVQDSTRKDLLKGNTPRNSGSTSMSKEQIMAVKDPAKRQKLIAENIDLFRPSK
ncbi:DUF4355 domain-containing protein [Limosilactobacillus fermentum]